MDWAALGVDIVLECSGKFLKGAYLREASGELVENCSGQSCIQQSDAS